MFKNLMFACLLLVASLSLGCGGGGGYIDSNSTKDPDPYKPIEPKVDQNYNVRRQFLGMVSANGVDMFAFVDVVPTGKAPYKITVNVQTSGAPTGSNLDCDWGDTVDPVKNQALDGSGKASIVHDYNIEGVFTLKLTLNIPNDTPLVLTSSNITITSDTAQLKVTAIQHVLSKNGQPRAELFNLAFTGGAAPFAYSWKFNSGQFANQTSTLPNPVFNIDLATGNWDCEVTITDKSKQTVTQKATGTGPYKPFIAGTVPAKAETGVNFKLTGFQFGANPGAVKISGPSGNGIVPYSTVNWSDTEISFTIDKPLVAGAHNLVIEAVHENSDPFAIVCVNPLTVDITLTEDTLERDRDFTVNAATTGGDGVITYDWTIKYSQPGGGGTTEVTDTPKTQQHKFKALIVKTIELSITVKDTLGVTATKTISTPNLLLSPFLDEINPNTFDAQSEVVLNGIFFGEDQTEIDVILGNEAKGRAAVSVGALKTYTNTQMKFDLPATALSGDLQVVLKKDGKELKSQKRAITVIPTAPNPPNGNQL